MMNHPESLIKAWQPDIKRSMQESIKEHQTQRFTDELLQRVQSKQDAINGICDRNYENFIGSVQQVVTIKSDVLEIQRKTQQLAKEVLVISKEALQKNESLKALERERDAIETAIIKIEDYRVVTDMALKIQRHVANEEFLHAVKYLNIVVTLIDTFKPCFVAEYLIEWVVSNKATIQKKLYKRVVDWLFETKRLALKIGGILMQQAEFHESLCRNLWSNNCLHSSNEDTSSLPSSSMIIDPNIPDKVLQTNEEYFIEMDTHVARLLDLEKVFEILSDRDNLQRFYHTNRRPQLELRNMMAGTLTLISEDKFVQSHAILCSSLLGNVIIERNLQKYCVTPLIDEDTLNHYFAVAVEEFCGLTKTHIQQVKSSSDFLTVKQTSIQLARLLPEYVHGFDVSEIIEIFRERSMYFFKLIQAETTKSLIDACESDSYGPLKVTQNEAEQLHLLYGLRHIDITPSPSLLVELPFTQSLIHSCRLITSLLERALAYTNQLNFLDWKDEVLTLVDAVLANLCDHQTQVLNKYLDMHISQLVQIAVNSAWLGVFVDFLELRIAAYFLSQNDVLSVRRYSGVTSNTRDARLSRSLLSARTKVELTSTRAQDLVCEIIVRNIEGLLGSLNFVDWAPSCPPKVAHACVCDLIDYMEVTLACLHHLPGPVRETVHFASCSCIHSCFMDVLIGKKITRINRNGLLPFKTDFDRVVAFALSCNVPDLTECFSPLGQFLDFLWSHLDSWQLDFSDEVASKSILQSYPQIHIDNIHHFMRKYDGIGKNPSECESQLTGRTRATTGGGEGSTQIRGSVGIWSKMKKKIQKSQSQ